MTLAIAALTQVFSRGWNAGFDFGAITVAGLAALVFVVLEVSGSVGARMGADAERWTEQELRRLRVRGCSTVSHIPFEKRDVDHAYLTPGGAWALETKWSAGAWRDLGEVRLRRAAEDAEISAQQLKNLLASRDIAVPMPVAPLVVLWGDWGTAPDVTELNVPIVRGCELREWLQPRLDAAGPFDVQKALSGLNAWLEKRDARIRTNDERPAIVRVGPSSLGLQILKAFLAGVAGIVAGSVFAGLSSPTLAVASVAVATLLGLAARRVVASAKLVASAWATGCAGGAAITAVLRSLG